MAYRETISPQNSPKEIPLKKKTTFDRFRESRAGKLITLGSLLFSGFGVRGAIQHFKDKAAFEDAYHHAVAEKKDMPRISDKEIVLKDNELDTAEKENLENGYTAENEKLFKEYTSATEEIFKGGLGFVVEDEGANYRDMRYIALAYFDQLHTFHSTIEITKMKEESSGMEEGELRFMENALQQHRDESFFVKNPSMGGIGRVSYG